MEKEIQQLLSVAGISRRYCCYDYFVKCVLKVVENPTRLQNICKEVYLPVAQECNKDVRAIEHGIRHARDILMCNNGVEMLAKMNGANLWHNKTPYPSDMIEVFAFYLLEKKQNTKE